MTLPEAPDRTPEQRVVPPVLALSFPMMRVRGIEVRLGYAALALFVVLLVCAALSPDELRRERFAMLGLVAALFFCMGLHEAGHALVAHLRGIRSTRIVLSIVGVTAFESREVKGSDEWRIALGGPAINLVIAALCVPFAYRDLTASVTQGVVPPFDTPFGFVAWVCGANAAIALFNLLPVYPMDGGKIVCGLLSLRLSRERSLRYVARISIVAGLMGGAYAAFRIVTRTASGFDIAVIVVCWLTVFASARALTRTHSG